MMERIEIRHVYRNIHTKRICEVTQKTFFNIQYQYIDDLYKRDHYIHHKDFKNLWEEI